MQCGLDHQKQQLNSEPEGPTITSLITMHFTKGARCHVSIFFKIFCFFDVDHIFKVFIEFVIILLPSLYFGFLASGHVGSQLPDQGSNLHPLHWKAKFLTTGPLKKSLLTVLLLKYVFIYLIYGCLNLHCRVHVFSSCTGADTLHCTEQASHCNAFSSCGARTLGAEVQQLWLESFRALAQQLWYVAQLLGGI